MDITGTVFRAPGQQDGLYYSMGYSGRGVQMSAHMGRVMADGRWPVPPMPTRGARCRGRPVPAHAAEPWMLPLVGVYYRLQDVLPTERWRGARSRTALIPA